MNIFKTNTNKLVRLLVPTFWRRKTTVGFLDALISPIIEEKKRFDDNRQKNLYRLSITPQVFSLEKMLNDRYDPKQRRIKLWKGFFASRIYLYVSAEGKPMFITSDKAKPLYTQKELGYVDSDFVVYVPGDINFSEDEMSVLLDIYKLVSKSHFITK